MGAPYLLFLLLPFLSASAAESVALSVLPEGAESPVALPALFDLAFPGKHSFKLAAPDNALWLNGRALHLTLVWPEDAPPDAGGLAWLKDRDDYWHQRLLPEALQPGVTNHLVIPFQAGAAGWQTPGHSLAWHYRVRLNPQHVGFRVFSDTTFTGKCVLVSATLETATDTSPPTITHVRALTREPQAFELYELRFNLPDRYENPFDPTRIDAGAHVVTPSGTTNTIHAFFFQPHYRLEDELGFPVEPDGPPEWRLRYCPREPGEHTVTLYARDAFGEVLLPEVIRFTAAPPAPDAMRFVRVSTRDRRFFEFDDGSLFYPIGHNIRSAMDDRMDDTFPWIFRPQEGTTAYRRYFQRLHEAGGNVASIWMSSWSLGLEWTAGVGGYHGANDYHMANAWELDRVLDLARQHRIHLNLVLNHHGRISSWCDPQWHQHPYNKLTPGGWLTQPLEFFSDPRALDMQKRFFRYTQARWGWSPAIFKYELCSELNLTGHETHHKTHFEPTVVAWCRTLARYLKSIDPYQRLVSVHTSNDYRLLNPELCRMPELDLIPLDAYHHGPPDRVVGLVARTSDAAIPYNKPILITEFGGSPMAATLEHLSIEHHAAIWAGACVPLGGIPMFWWWQVVDENNFYSRYTAIRRFMENVDPRDPSSRRVEVALTVPGSDGNAVPARLFSAVATASPERARGYIHSRPFPRLGEEPPETTSMTATLEGFKPGLFRVEFYETRHGKVVRRFDLRSQNGMLVIPVPPFRSDCAFKVNLLMSVSAP